MKRKKSLLALELLVRDDVEVAEEVDTVPWPCSGQAGVFMAWWPARLLQGLLPGVKCGAGGWLRGRRRRRGVGFWLLLKREEGDGG
jgi:hypothetical protein